jgi:aminopeptidase YwaD
MAMRWMITALSLTLSAPLLAGSLPFLTDDQATALDGELSGESAKRNLEGLSRLHRMRGSREFHRASELVVGELKKYGYADAHIEQLAADGKVFYGTQRSRPAWNADFAELWELDASGKPTVRMASWDAAPITLAEDSVSADVTASLVDAGEGGNENDYAGKDVKGKLVLVGGQPGAVQSLAVGKFGAAGIVSYAPNQRTAWWKQDETLVRWGHLDTFSSTPTFAFMISLGNARALRERLAKGEAIRLHAVVKAGQEPGFYDIATATIPGADPAVRDEEIVFSCHLDHPRPGANDNASGCATILEVARTLHKLIDEKRIAPPRRTIRFVWPPEIEGTMALLNGRPELAARIKAAIHLDMVGGGAETKTIFHVTRGPASLPSFVYDVAAKIGAAVDDQTSEYAMTGSAKWPLIAPEGGREALRAAFVPLTLGSDHEVYSGNSWSIPAIYLNDWPDRFIHPNADTAAKIDPTKLKRAGFIAAASGLVLANAQGETMFPEVQGESNAEQILETLKEASLRRAADALAQSRGLPAAEAANRLRFQFWYEARMVSSMSRFFSLPPGVQSDADTFLASLRRLLPDPGKAPTPTGPVYRRNRAVRGSLDAFGYDYLADHLGREAAGKLALPAFEGIRGGGEDYVYEALNLADGSRTTSEIRDALSAIYGPVPQDVVDAFLAAAAKAGLLEPS